MKGVLSYVALGANLGDRLASMREAVRRIDDAPGLSVLRASRVYETAPVGPPQPDYLNAVVEVDACLSPRAHLAVLRRIEDDLGRTRTVENGPRTLDLDLLWQGGLSLAGPELVLPHPRMTGRAFVLAPLSDLAPELVLAGTRVQDWLSRVSSQGVTPVTEQLLPER